MMEGHTKGNNMNTSQESDRNTEDSIGEALKNLLSLAKMLQEQTLPQKTSPTKPSHTVPLESHPSTPQQEMNSRTSQTVSRDVPPAAQPVGRMSKTQTPSPNKSATQGSQSKGYQTRTEDQERMKTYYSTNQQALSNPTIHERNRFNATVNRHSQQRIHSHPYNSAASVPKATNIPGSAPHSRDKNVTRKYNVPHTNDFSHTRRNRDVAGQNSSAMGDTSDKLNATKNQSVLNVGRNVSNLNILSSVNQSQTGKVDSRLDVRSKYESPQVQPGSSGHNLCNSSRNTSSFDSAHCNNSKTINSQKVLPEKQMHQSHKLDSKQQQQTHSQTHSKTTQHKQCSKLMQNEKFTKNETQMEANISTTQHTKNSLNRENKHAKTHTLNPHGSSLKSSTNMNEETSASRKLKLKSSGRAKNAEESAPKSCEDSKSSARYPPGIEKTLQVIANNIKNNTEQNKETATPLLPKKQSSSKSKKKDSMSLVTNLTKDQKSNSTTQSKQSSHTQERKHGQNIAIEPKNNCSSKETFLEGEEKQTTDKTVQRKKSEGAMETLKRFSFGDSNIPKQKDPAKSSIRISLEDLVSCTEDQSKQTDKKDHQSVSLGNEEEPKQKHCAENKGLDEDLPMLVRSRRHSAKQCMTRHNANTSTTDNQVTIRNSSPKAKDTESNGHKIHKSYNEISKLQDILTTEYKDAKNTATHSEPIQQNITLKKDYSVESEVKIPGEKGPNFDNSTEIQGNAHCKFLNFLTRAESIKKNLKPDGMNASKCNKQLSTPVNYQNDAVATETGNIEKEQNISPQNNKTSEKKSMEKGDSNISSKLKTESDQFSTKDFEKPHNAQPLILTNIKEEPEWEMDCTSVPDGSSKGQMKENCSEKINNNKEDSNRNIWENLQLHDEANSNGILKRTGLDALLTQKSHTTKGTSKGKVSQKNLSNEKGKTWQQLMNPSGTLNIEIPTNPGLMPIRIKTEPVSPPVTKINTSLVTENAMLPTNNRQQKVKDQQIGNADSNKGESTTKTPHSRDSKPSPIQQNKDDVPQICVKQEPVDHAFPSPDVIKQNTASNKSTEILTESQKSSSVPVRQEKKISTETPAHAIDSSEFLHKKGPSSRVSTCLETTKASVAECDGQRENGNSPKANEIMNEQSKVKDKNNCFDASSATKRVKTQISPIKFISDSDEKETCGPTKTNVVNQKVNTSTCKTKVNDTGNRATTSQNTGNSLSVSIPSIKAIHTSKKNTNKRKVIVGDTFIQQKISPTSTDKNTLEISKDKNKSVTSCEAGSLTSQDTTGKNPVQSDKEAKKSISSVVAPVSVKEKIIERQKKVGRQTREQSVARQIVRKRITATPARSFKTPLKSTQSGKSMKENNKSTTKTTEVKSNQSQNLSTKQKERQLSKNARTETTGTSREKDTTLRKPSKLNEEKENQRTSEKTNLARRRWSPRNNDLKSRSDNCSCLRCRQQRDITQRHSNRYREKSPESRFTSQYKPNYRYETAANDKYRSRDTRSDKSYYYDSGYREPDINDRYPRYNSPPRSPGSWSSSYDSYRRGRSPTYISSSPDYRWRSPRGRSISPFRREKSPRRSRSPPYRTRSPFQRHRSPYHRSRSPMPRSRSPIHRSRSPLIRSRSPEYRKYRSPKNDARSKRIISPPHSNSSMDSLLENFMKSTTKESNEKAQLFSTSVQQFGQDSFTTTELPKPQQQALKQNKLKQPPRNNAPVIKKMQEMTGKPNMTEVGSALEKSLSSSAGVNKNNQSQLKTTQVKKTEHIRQSNLIQIDTTSFQVNKSNVTSLKPTEPNQMPTISSNKKDTELESNVKSKRVLVRKKQRNQRRREKKRVRRKKLLQTSGTKSKNLEKITNDGEKKTVEVEKQRLDEAPEQKVKNAEQNMKGQTIKSKQDETKNKHIDKENGAVKQSKEEKTHTLKQMEFAIEPSANKEIIHVPFKQIKKLTERENSLEKEKQVETNNMMNITEKPSEKEKQAATETVLNITMEMSSGKEKQTGTVLNITKMSSEKEVKQTATEDKLSIPRKKSPESRQQATMATDNILNTNITIQKSSEKEKQMETDDTMMITNVKCTTKEANETDQSKLHASESVQTVVIGTESAKLKKATSEEVPSDKQPEKETRKAPLKEDTLEFKAKEKSVKPINPTTSEYVDINLKNMTHIYICDGRQVCNAFNMSTFTGIGCPGTCNQLHLSLPIYNPHSKINMSVPQIEELADVLKDTKGNVCFFNLSQKMICNNFNSEEGCMNKNCFMIHTSFYEIFNAYFIRKLRVRKTPRYVKRQSSLTEQCKTKPPLESDLKCKVRQHPKERVSEPHDHVKDSGVQVKDVQKVCKLNVKENCTNEKETSNNKSSLEKLQKAQPIKDQQRRGQNKISGTSSKQLTPDDKSGKNQEDTSYREQGKSSSSMANKPEEKVKVDTSERTKTKQPENTDDLVTVINVKSPWRICRFFNTAGGCRRWKCPYQHVQNQPLRSVKSNMKSNLKNSTSYESPSTRKERITQEDFPASTEKHSHPAAKKMKKTKLSEIFKGSEKQTKEKTCGKIIGQKVKQETSAFQNTENPVMKINANAETNKACEVKNPITETVKKPQSDASKSSESNAIKEPNSGSSDMATNLKDNNGNNNQRSTVSASATSNYPPYRKRKLKSNFQDRAAKIPRQSRIPNMQALLTRQKIFMTRNSSFSYNHNCYNSDTSDWRFEQSGSYRVPDRRLEHSQNYREPQWRQEQSQNFRDPEWRVEHSQNYREQRLCPDFNTQWGCPLTNWECPYIHDYAEDIHFS